MPLPREVLDEHVARLNARRPPALQVHVESYEEPGRFTLSFPNRAMPEGQCIDQDFSEIQFDLHDARGLFTAIQRGRHDEASDRYLIDYETVEWD